MKKCLAMLLALMMIPCVYAEEAPRVYVSISDDAGALVLAYAPVTVTDADGDGLLTLSDALHCAHVAYHPDGADAFVAERTEWGISLYVLWGVDNGGSYGYCLNDASPLSLLDPVQAGDHIKAYAYTDLTAYSDTYCYFASPVAAVRANEAVSLTLTANGYDESWNPITMPVAGAVITVNGERTDWVTDANGGAALTLPAGEYVLSAVSDSLTLVPPVCILTVPAAVEDRADGLISDILAFQMAKTGAESVADWVRSGLPGMMGAGGEWYAIALRQRGGDDLSAAREALLDYTASTKIRAASTRQKLALTLMATGGSTDFVDATLADSFGKQGLMSWVWGLHLLNNGCNGQYPAAEVVKTLLDMRKADGGWAITGNAADPDATAMALQALAPHRDDPAVARAVDAAVELLAKMQLPGGGYASYGVENAESAAQVIIALCALDIDPCADGRFTRDGATLLDGLTAFRKEDGSFSHEKGGPTNENATAQTFLALTALEHFRAGKGSLFLLDEPAQPGEIRAERSWKAVAVQIIAGAASAACVLLMLLGKRKMKDYLAVALIAAALTALVGLLDIQSAEDYYSETIVKSDAIGSVTLTIRCDAVAGRAGHIPADGVLLREAVLPIAEGDTVYAVLTDAARIYGLHLDASGAPGMMYLHGIGNIYEFDFGDLSGWLYAVNGETFSKGCDQYILADGDVIEWRYTLEMGRDLP